MLHLLPRPSTARSRSSSTAQERALGRICAGKGLSVSRGGTQRGMQGGSGICFQLLATGIRQSCPWGRSRRGSSWVLGVAPPQWGPWGLSPAPQNRAVEHRRSKGAARDPLCPLERGRGHTAARFPNTAPSFRPPLGRCPLQFHKPQSKDAAPGQPLSFSPSPHTAPQPPNPKASRQPRWSRENPKADIRAWQHWAGVPGPSPRAEFRHFGEEPEQPQVTGTGDI